MITEVAHIEIDPSKAEDFEAAVAECVPLFQAAQGCQSMTLHKIIEDPAQYRLLVCWQTITDHMVHFRQSVDFQTWRETAGVFFVRPPRVEHFDAGHRFFSIGG